MRVASWTVSALFIATRDELRGVFQRHTLMNSSRV
jgi:hypothetical protein